MSKTEKQIIQALKICRSDNSCTECPYYSGMSELATDALNLIEKQREEINELTGKHWNEFGQIARYSDELNQFADIGKMYSEIKAEVIKDFAEKMKAKMQNLSRVAKMKSLFEASNDDAVYFLVGHKFIDNLVKEMTGGEENAD